MKDSIVPKFNALKKCNDFSELFCYHFISTKHTNLSMMGKITY